MATSLPALVTDRLLLRPLNLGDAPAAQKLFPTWEIVRYMDAVVPWPYPADGALAFYSGVVMPAMERGEAWHWSVRLKDEPGHLIGAINLKRGERENRGFWIGKPWQGRGIASEACAAVNDFWFDTLGFPVLRVGKAAANEPSRRISMREGMRLVATEERDFVSGRLSAEVWELTAVDWRLRRRVAHPEG